jgi:hypothetical protein
LKSIDRKPFDLRNISRLSKSDPNIIEAASTSNNDNVIYYRTHQSNQKKQIDSFKVKDYGIDYAMSINLAVWLLKWSKYLEDLFEQIKISRNVFTIDSFSIKFKTIDANLLVGCVFLADGNHLKPLRDIIVLIDINDEESSRFAVVVDDDLTEITRIEKNTKKEREEVSNDSSTLDISSIGDNLLIEPLPFVAAEEKPTNPPSPLIKKQNPNNMSRTKSFELITLKSNDFRSPSPPIPKKDLFNFPNKGDSGCENVKSMIRDELKKVIQIQHETILNFLNDDKPNSHHQQHQNNKGEIEFIIETRIKNKNNCESSLGLNTSSCFLLKQNLTKKLNDQNEMVRRHLIQSASSSFSTNLIKIPLLGNNKNEPKHIINSHIVQEKSHKKVCHKKKQKKKCCRKSKSKDRINYDSEPKKSISIQLPLLNFNSNYSNIKKTKPIIKEDFKLPKTDQKSSTKTKVKREEIEEEVEEIEEQIITEKIIPKKEHSEPEEIKKEVETKLKPIQKDFQGQVDESLVANNNYILPLGIFQDILKGKDDNNLNSCSAQAHYDATEHLRTNETTTKVTNLDKAPTLTPDILFKMHFDMKRMNREVINEANTTKREQINDYINITDLDEGKIEKELKKTIKENNESISNLSKKEEKEESPFDYNQDFLTQKLLSVPEAFGIDKKQSDIDHEKLLAMDGKSSVFSNLRAIDVKIDKIKKLAQNMDNDYSKYSKVLSYLGGERQKIEDQYNLSIIDETIKSNQLDINKNNNNNNETLDPNNNSTQQLPTAKLQNLNKIYELASKSDSFSISMIRNEDQNELEENSNLLSQPKSTRYLNNLERLKDDAEILKILDENGTITSSSVNIDSNKLKTNQNRQKLIEKAMRSAENDSSLSLDLKSILNKNEPTNNSLLIDDLLRSSRDTSIKSSRNNHQRKQRRIVEYNRKISPIVNLEKHLELKRDHMKKLNTEQREQDAKQLMIDILNDNASLKEASVQAKATTPRTQSKSKFNSKSPPVRDKYSSQTKLRQLQNQFINESSLLHSIQSNQPSMMAKTIKKLELDESIKQAANDRQLKNLQKRANKLTTNFNKKQSQIKNSIKPFYEKVHLQDNSKLKTKPAHKTITYTQQLTRHQVTKSQALDTNDNAIKSLMRLYGTRRIPGLHQQYTRKEPRKQLNYSDRLRQLQPNRKTQSVVNNSKIIPKNNTNKQQKRFNPYNSTDCVCLDDCCFEQIAELSNWSIDDNLRDIIYDKNIKESLKASTINSIKRNEIDQDTLADVDDNYIRMLINSNDTDTNRIRQDSDYSYIDQVDLKDLENITFTSESHLSSCIDWDQIDKMIDGNF